MAGNREALAQLIAEAAAEYRRTLPGKLAEIEALWLEATQGALSGERYAELRRLIHTLAGSAKTFGLPAVSEAARALELAISPGDCPGSPEVRVAQARGLFDALKQSAAGR